MSDDEDRTVGLTIFGKGGKKSRLISTHEGRFPSLQIPLVGERYTMYTKGDVDMEFMALGDREINNYCQTVNGRMTSEMYELFMNENVNYTTVQELYPSDNNGDVSRKVMYLHRRYYKDEHNLIHDQLRGDTVVFNPIFTYDMIMGCHLMNGHAGSRNVHHAIAEFYGCASRQLVDKTLQYCSKCNPERTMMPLSMRKAVNIYKQLMPLERVHFEIFEPYPGEKIEGKYSHVLFCRDYYSRFLWMAPLKNTKFKKIVPAVASLLLSLPRIPIFIESSTLNWQDMFDIFEEIAGKYSLTIGLGTDTKSRIFHVGGIAPTRRRFLENKAECIKDWNMCLSKCCTRKNYLFDMKCKGVPSNLLSSNIPNLKRKFKLKREDYLFTATSQCIVDVGKGRIYLEMSDEADPNIESNLLVNDSDDNEEEDEEEFLLEQEALNAVEYDGFNDSDDEVMKNKGIELDKKQRERSKKKKQQKQQQKKQQQKDQKKLQQMEKQNTTTVTSSTTEEVVATKGKDFEDNDVSDTADLNDDTVTAISSQSQMPLMADARTTKRSTFNIDDEQYEASEEPEQSTQATQVPKRRKLFESPEIADPSTSYFQGQNIQDSPISNKQQKQKSFDESMEI